MNRRTPSPLIEGYTLGPFATNCYIVHVPPEQECWIIDASYAPEPLIDRVRQLNLAPSRLILTHAHGDHIAGLEQVRAAFPGARVAIHKAEADWLGDPVKNLSAGFGPPVVARPADDLLQGGETLELFGTRWKVLHTPGHSPGGIALVLEDGRAAITGDTLFEDSIGRTDFPGGDAATLARSIRERLYTLPDDTRVFPGHGRPTTIGHEKQSNPYVKG